MDFSTSPEDEEFRARLREFIAAHDPGAPPHGFRERLTWTRAFAATLADEGWAAPSWPKEVGGMELPLAQQVIWHEEMALARMPDHPCTILNVVGATLIKHGADDQRSRFLRPLLRADEIWGQGFSEPEAGSDLPALRTRAVLDGDHYVVDGQKVWTTQGAIADWLFVLTRTGSQDERERGITCLLVPAAADGVVIRPLRDMAGDAGFAQCFFTGVQVPVSQRVGAEGDGWRVARTSLGHERSTSYVARSIRYRRIVSELQAVARTRGLTDDPRIRQRLADAEIRARLLSLNGMRTFSHLSKHGEPGPGSSTARLFHTLFEQRLHELAVDVLGMAGQLDRRDPYAIERGRWTWGFLRTRGSTIGAGTAEIQRNTIAEQILGLPRG